MSKFKIGDRVAIYHIDGRTTGIVKDILQESDDYVGVLCPKNTQLLWVHAKQCRRIKPAPKAREWEMSWQSYDGVLREVAVGPEIRRDEVVRVREVRPKRSK